MSGRHQNSDRLPLFTLLALLVIPLLLLLNFLVRTPRLLLFSQEEADLHVFKKALAVKRRFYTEEGVGVHVLKNYFNADRLMLHWVLN